MSNSSENNSWLDRPIRNFFHSFSGELLIFIFIIALAAITRFYDLGARVMSHDENLHVFFSWLFSIGKGYQHSPLMHGPLQFHLIALAFQFFGASDFVARLPHAVASILSIVLLWNWRQYLGRAGTLVAAVLMLISPYLLYYGRYARNEAFIGIYFVLTLYAILRYLETGSWRYLILLTIATVLHFCSKETAFIYTAQALLFLAVYLINRVTRSPWKNDNARKGFLISLSIGLISAAAAVVLVLYARMLVVTDASQTAAPIIPGQLPEASTLIKHLSSGSAFWVISGIALILVVVFLVAGYGWKALCRERSFDMLIVLGTFVVPQLAAFPVTVLGWNPLDYQFTWPGWNLAALWAQPPVRTLLVFILLCFISIVIGLLWNGKRWFILAIIFWGIYIIFYTSLFTNWQGFFTGTIGSLGYWLQQQGVHRGDQPWYYYILVQIPIYEFLPALGFCLATFFGFRKHTSTQPNSIEHDAKIAPGAGDLTPGFPSDNVQRNISSEGNYSFQLLFWWTLSSLLAYTLAGEKMPWLTYHITLPMILLTGWGLGQMIERVNWYNYRNWRGWSAIILFVVLFSSMVGLLARIIGANPPFQGKSLEQLAATSSFIFLLVIILSSLFGVNHLLKGRKIGESLQIALLVFFLLLAFLTGRSAIRAAFLNPDDAREYLVYAHGADGIRDVMDQIGNISARVVGEKNLQLAYDNNLPNQGVSWSFKWYLRNYLNAKSFDVPDDSLRNIPVIIVDQQTYAKIKPIVGEDYYQLEYVRMVWPNQDYFSLTWSRIKNMLADPRMRDALIQIWLNRDYSEYASVTGKNSLSLLNWQPSATMRLYIHKDIAAQLWDYGISQSANLVEDPYEKGTISLEPDFEFGSVGAGNGQFNTPRGLTIASNGTIFVADSRNNRIELFDIAGNFLNSIGKASPGCPYDTIPPVDVPLDTFCEPWAMSISPDGKWLYVADTWNHRILKLASDGTALKSWGTPNYDPISSGPDGLWGPRGIAVNSQGSVLVADTGNKRIVIYDDDGNYLSQLGGGTGDIQFDEPVGLSLDNQGYLYVADTWNQRVQVFSPNKGGTIYTFSRQWDIAGWSSQSLDNKPYLAADLQGHVFTADPDSFRILEFTTEGVFIRAWGNFGSATENFGLPSGIAVDDQGQIWISDVSNNRVIRFSLPASP
jgi:uncharacterized protein (TIGR03663 family)